MKVGSRIGMGGETVDIDVNNKVYEYWEYVKTAIQDAGVPCGNSDCRSCSELKGAIIVLDRYVNELSGRFECL